MSPKQAEKFNLVEHIAILKGILNALDVEAGAAVKALKEELKLWYNKGAYRPVYEANLCSILYEWINSEK